MKRDSEYSDSKPNSPRLQGVSSRSVDSSRKLFSSKLLNLNSSKQLYAARLESRVLELQQLTQTQKMQISLLKDQKRYLQRICKKQQQKLQNRSDELLVQALTSQIQQLKLDRQRIMDLMRAVTAQQQNQILVLKSQLQKALQHSIYLQQSVAQIIKDNRTLGDRVQSLKDSQKRLQQLERQVAMLRELNQRYEDELYDKRNIERKFKISLLQIQRLEHENRNAVIQ